MIAAEMLKNVILTSTNNLMILNIQFSPCSQLNIIFIYSNFFIYRLEFE